MSLINQMLTDLEARRGGSVRHVDHALDGLSPAPGSRRARRRRGALVAVLLVLGVAVAAGLLWKFRLAPAPLPAAPAPEPVTSAPVAAAATPAPPASPVTPPPPVAAATPQPVLLADHPSVAPAPAPVEAVPTAGSPPVPADVTPPSPPPAVPAAMDAAPAPPAPLASAQQDTAPAVTAAPAAAPEPAPRPVKQPATPAPPKEPAVQADTGGPTVEQPGSFHRIPATNGLPPAEALAYARALKALEQGATAGMADFVAAHPAHAEARERLALALFAAGRNSEAEGLLRAGLAATPKSTRFAELLGHALVERGDAAGAQAVLRAAAPALASNPDYHGLLAAAEQATDSHALAATRYRALLQLQPGNGRWWVGLGISLRALGDPRQAVQAFDRALDDRSLPEPLRAYAARETVRLKER